MHIFEQLAPPHSDLPVPAAALRLRGSEAQTAASAQVTAAQQRIADRCHPHTDSKRGNTRRRRWWQRCAVGTSGVVGPDTAGSGQSAWWPWSSRMVAVHGQKATPRGTTRGAATAARPPSRTRPVAHSAAPRSLNSTLQPTAIAPLPTRTRSALSQFPLRSPPLPPRCPIPPPAQCPRPPPPPRPARAPNGRWTATQTSGACSHDSPTPTPTARTRLIRLPVPLRMPTHAAPRTRHRRCAAAPTRAREHFHVSRSTRIAIRAARVEGLDGRSGLDALLGALSRQIGAGGRWTRSRASRIEFECRRERNRRNARGLDESNGGRRREKEKKDTGENKKRKNQRTEKN